MQSIDGAPLLGLTPAPRVDTVAISSPNPHGLIDGISGVTDFSSGLLDMCLVCLHRMYRVIDSQEEQ
jgi:hypothetical protein